MRLQNGTVKFSRRGRNGVQIKCKLAGRPPASSRAGAEGCRRVPADFHSVSPPTAKNLSGCPPAGCPPRAPRRKPSASKIKALQKAAGRYRREEVGLRKLAGEFSVILRMGTNMGHESARRMAHELGNKYDKHGRALLEPGRRRV